jgi:S1-C subfamily serine protease
MVDPGPSGPSGLDPMAPSATPRPSPLWLAAGIAAGVLLAPPAAAQSGKPPPLDVQPSQPFAPIPRGAPSLDPAPRPAPQPSQLPSLAGKPPPLPPGNGPFGAVPEGGRARASGTGFAIAQGRIITNHHVVEGCTEVRLRTSSGAEFSAAIQARDPQRDLALLTTRGDIGPPLRFRASPEIRRGEPVVTYGFPLAGLLSSGPTLTTGDVSALSGLRDNPQHFQISAPVQPGNSGGPLLDLAGNVVGVVTSKLNAQRVAQSTGDIPQNVNFAIKGVEVVDFLRRNGVNPTVADSTTPLRSAAEVGEVAHVSTLFLRCMR